MLNSQHQLLIDCSYIVGFETKSLLITDFTASNTEQVDRLPTTSSIKVAKKLLHGKEQLLVEVVKAIYTTPIGEQYKGMLASLFFC